jgi:hypothetical protein
MVNKGSSAYIESVPPIVDILAVLHRKVIGYDAQNLKLETQDRFILSKAHAGIGEYITLVEVGVKDKYIATTGAQEYLRNTVRTSKKFIIKSILRIDRMLCTSSSSDRDLCSITRESANEFCWVFYGCFIRLVVFWFVGYNACRI